MLDHGEAARMLPYEMCFTDVRRSVLDTTYIQQSPNLSCYLLNGKAS
jgi:hypothetical protein